MTTSDPATTDMPTAFRRAVAEAAHLESEDARMAVARRHLAGLPMAEGQAWAVEVWAARRLPDWVVLRALGLCDDDGDEESVVGACHISGRV